MAEPHLRFPIVLSIGAALLTLVLKATAYALTDSVGLLSDALESLVNLAAAVTAFLCLRVSSVPPDRAHAFGHSKIDYFSSGLEGVLILVAAAGIAWYAVQRILQGKGPDSLDVGASIALAASLINLAVAQVLLRAGRKHRSIVLEADGHHLMTDVYTSFGVVAGLFLVHFTGWIWLDPLAALVMAANIVWTAWSLLNRSFQGLMDHSLPEADMAKLRAAIDTALEPGTHYHALRTRQAGTLRFVDFHLLVPGKWNVAHAHAYGDRISEAICVVLADTEVTVHIEPIEAGESWNDSSLLRLEEPERTTT